jgi:hypothetical protein
MSWSRAGVDDPKTKMRKIRGFVINNLRLKGHRSFFESDQIRAKGSDGRKHGSVLLLGARKYLLSIFNTFFLLTLWLCVLTYSRWFTNWSLRNADWSLGDMIWSWSTYSWFTNCGDGAWKRIEYWNGKFGSLFDWEPQSDEILGSIDVVSLVLLWSLGVTQNRTDTICSPFVIWFFSTHVD